MNRKSFLLSLPLIGLAVKVFSKPEKKKPVLVPNIYYGGCDPYNDDVSKNRIVTFKKCDDGKFIIHNNQTGETTKGNLIWTDDAEIKLV